MNIGNLNKRISIYSTATTADGAGGFTKASETLVCSVWASIVEKIRSTTATSGAIVQYQSIEILMRRLRFDIDRTYFIMHGAKKYSIESVIQDEYTVKIIAHYEV